MGATEDAAPTLASPPVNGRYRVVRLLGVGGEGRVFLVEDLREGGRPLALKTLPRGAATEPLRKEFSLRSKLIHPNLARVHELDVITAAGGEPGGGLDRGCPFFTADFVEGAHADEAAPEAMEERAVWAAHLALATSRALALVHARGLLHGDVKPRNLLVGGDPLEAKLVDFGLARRRGERRGELGGSLPFIAPEALLGDADSRSDLYSLGVVLYRILSGRLPVDVPAQGDLRPALTAVLEGRFPALDVVAPAVPPSVAAVVERLLRRDPAERYRAARDLALDLARTGLCGHGDEALGLDVYDADSEVEGAEEKAAYVLSAGFVDRDRELDRLQALLEARLEGGPEVSPVIVLRGEPGIGRSRLVREVHRRLELLRVAAGRPAPRFVHGALQNVARALGARGSGALADVILSTREAGGLLVHVEEGDPGLPGLAEEVVRGDDGESGPLGFALVVEASPEATLAGEAIDLAPISREDVGRLAAAVVGRPLPDEFVGALARASEGVPALVEAALLALASERPLASLEQGDLGALEVPEEIERTAAKRLGALPARLADVLHALAVLDRPCRDRDVAALLEIPRDETFERLRALTLRGLVRMDAEGAVQIASAVRRAASMAVPSERRVALHEIAYRIASEDRPDALDERARHALAAGRNADGAELAVDAARLAERTGDLGAAESLLRLARKVLPAARKAKVSLSLASLLRTTGRYDESASLLEPLAEKDPAAALSLGETLRRQGRIDEALARLRQAARSGDAAVRAEARALAARTLLDGGRAGEAIEEAGDPEPVAPPATNARYWEAVGLARLHTGELPGASRAFEKASDAAEADGDPALRARARMLLGTVAHRRGDASRAAERYEEAAELARVAREVHTEAAAMVNLGNARSEQGRLAPALTAYRAGVRVLRRLGRPAELANAYFNYGNLLALVGDAEAARRVAGRALAAAREAGHADAEVHSLLLAADLARQEGRVEDARARLVEADARASEAGLVGATGFVRVGAAEVALVVSDPDLARREALAAMEASGPDAEDVLARADLVLARAALARGDAAEARERAAAAVERFERLGRADGRFRARVALAAAMEATADGRAAAERRAAAEEVRRLAAEVPEAYRAAFLQDPERRAVLDAAGTAREPAEVGSPGLWRRLSQVTKRMTTELRPAVLLEFILDTAIELTGADRGFLLVRAKDGTLKVRCARNLSKEALSGRELALSRSIAEGVAERSEPLVAVDALSDGRFGDARSVHDLRLRSILAVPLRLHGESLGALYLDDRFRPGAFGQTEVDVLRELADQAAIALENARLHRENRRRARRIELLARRLERTVQSQRTALSEMKERLDRSLEDLQTKYRYEGIVGRSPAMIQMLKLLDRVTDAEVPVVIQGESGTGKELVARAIHYNGARRTRPFVAVNCGSFTETLLESELFGHVRGAFTGADRSRPGLFEAANGGTLFLDEVGETSAGMQAKLLRALQEGEVRPVGGNETRKVSVRVIAASNRDLQTAVREGRFREDLFYRLNVVAVKLPPLRERREDLPLLLEHFLAKHGAGRTIAVDKRAMARLFSYTWPGNVRQLENEVMRLAVLADEAIREEHLSPEIVAGGGDEELQASEDLDIKSQVERLERRLIRRALREARGNQSKASRLLGLSRYGLQKKLKRYGLA